MVKTIWKSVVILSAVRATFFILELLLMSLINGLSGTFTVLQERSQEFLNVAVVVCSGQLIPDSILRFSSAATGGMPPLNV